MRRPLVFLLFSPICLYIASCRQKTESTKPTVGQITESAYASGTVKSRHQYQLFGTVNGIIRDIFVKEGDIIRKGDPIMKIKNDAARLTQENARISADYSAISKNADKLNELQANINFAEGKLQSDSSLFIRQKNLWAQGIGTKNELDSRELAVLNSRTNYEAALLRYNALKRQIEYAAKQTLKSEQISAVQLNDYTIKSESDGRVYDLLKEKGEMVTTLSPVAIIGDANEFLLELKVDEYDIAKIKPGQLVVVGLDSYKGEVFEAVIDKIDPIMDERSRSFTVEASFTKKPTVLYPFLSAEANIVIRTKEKAITIPRIYLVDETYVINEKNERKKVVTGIKDYRKVEIISGLDSTEIILKPVK